MAEISRAELKYFVERQRQEIKTLNEVGRLLSSTTDPKQIVRLAASYLSQAYPVALCEVLFLPQHRLHILPFAPIASMELAGTLRRVREAASELAGRTIGEADSQPEEMRSSAQLQPATVLRSHLFSPITDKGRPVGLLAIFSGKAEAFTQEDQQAVGIIAEQLGAALRNAVLVEELRRADELKNQLLSIVSHELSTPLTAIKEGVNLVLDGSLGETTTDQRDFLTTVNENAERLERIIQKIKTSTELMTGQARFAIESADLRAMLSGVEKTYRNLAASRKVNVKLIEHPKPLFWPVDAAHLVIAVNQIVENAIQATSSDGLVTLKLAPAPSEVEIQVTDTGSGIAKESLPTLFEQFKSVGDINNRKMGGLGLGLYIAKSLVAGHGGTIEVASTVGEGTVMTIRLPRAGTVT